MAEKKAQGANQVSGAVCVRGGPGGHISARVPDDRETGFFPIIRRKSISAYSYFYFAGEVTMTADLM